MHGTYDPICMQGGAWPVTLHFTTGCLRPGSETGFHDDATYDDMSKFLLVKGVRLDGSSKDQ